MARSKGIRRALALLVVTVALVAMAASPASAGPRINCAMTGHVLLSQNPAGDWSWGITAAGPCLNFLSGPYTAIATGEGHSDTLGLCGGLLVQNLVIDVKLTVMNLRTGQVKVTNETWGAPLTTFPLATPFIVGGGQSGVGAISTRILLGCPPGGSSVATFVFSTST